MSTKVARGLVVFHATVWLLVLGFALYISLPQLMPTAARQLAPNVMLNTPFSLVDQNGGPVTEATFATKATAWFYGFTHCPDVCPTTLSEMTALLERLGPDADEINMVFVTVDPERDTPQVMKAYISVFDTRIVGLTGSVSELARIAKERMFTFEKVPLDGGDYTMNHTASIYLTRASGEFAGTLDIEESLDVKLQKLKRLLGND